MRSLARRHDDDRRDPRNGLCREVADRVMFFDQGRIAHDAPPKEFFSNPANDRIRAFLGQVSHQPYSQSRISRKAAGNRGLFLFFLF